MIYFTKHAREKFAVLKRHKFIVTERDVLSTVRQPDLIDYSRASLLIAQRKIDRGHVLRAIFKKEFADIRIITFYPGRLTQYKKHEKTT